MVIYATIIKRAGYMDQVYLHTNFPPASYGDDHLVLSFQTAEGLAESYCKDVLNVFDIRSVQDECK